MKTITIQLTEEDRLALLGMLGYAQGCWSRTEDSLNKEFLRVTDRILVQVGAHPYGEAWEQVAADLRRDGIEVGP
jgi:hypothetical protein